MKSTEPDLTGGTGCAEEGVELEQGERALGPGTPGKDGAGVLFPVSFRSLGGTRIHVASRSHFLTTLSQTGVMSKSLEIGVDCRRTK